MKTLESILTYSLEGFLMAGASLSLIGLKLEIRRLISIAVIYSFFVYFVRHIYFLLKIPLGTHTFILMLIFALLTMLIGKVNLLAAFISSLTSILLIFWGEGIFLYPALVALNIDLISVMNSHFGYTFLAVFISDILLVISFIIGYIFNISLINLSQEKIIVDTKE